MSGLGDQTPIQSGSAPTRPGDGERAPRPSTLNRVREWLSHPLVLLLVGALISSVLVPSLTRQWQNHEKELEIKSSLVEDMNNSVTDFVMAVQFAEVGSSSQSQADYDKAYRNWEIKRGQLESKIRVYFPASRIADEWSRYSRTVTDFYVLSGTTEEPERVRLVGRLTDYFGQGDFQELVARTPDPSDAQYRSYAQAWETMKERILSKKDEFINLILRSSSALG